MLVFLNHDCRNSNSLLSECCLYLLKFINNLSNYCYRYKRTVNLPWIYFARPIGYVPILVLPSY